jgi:predicted ATP-dependent endonuclease of OLD family
LREYREHQFIISTHSPEVFSASEPQKIILLKYIDEQTVLNEIDSDDINGARYVLDEIGAKLSDVLGADVVVWVEGPTEQDCFPLILKSINRPPRPGKQSSLCAIRAI